MCFCHIGEQASNDGRNAESVVRLFAFGPRQRRQSEARADDATISAFSRGGFSDNDRRHPTVIECAAGVNRLFRFPPVNVGKFYETAASCCRDGRVSRFWGLSDGAGFVGNSTFRRRSFALITKCLSLHTSFFKEVNIDDISIGLTRGHYHWVATLLHFGLDRFSARWYNVYGYTLHFTYIFPHRRRRWQQQAAANS